MNTSPLPIEDLAERLRGLARVQRRARLRLLMPTIDDLARQGVTHREMSEVLSAAGIPLQPDSLRKALSRWRLQRERQRSSSDTRSAPGAAPRTLGPIPSNTPAGYAASPVPITSKEGLARLRQASAPDLNALAALGRQKQE